MCIRIFVRIFVIRFNFIFRFNFFLFLVHSQNANGRRFHSSSAVNGSCVLGIEMRNARTTFPTASIPRFLPNCRIHTTLKALRIKLFVSRTSRCLRNRLNRMKLMEFSFDVVVIEGWREKSTTFLPNSRVIRSLVHSNTMTKSVIVCCHCVCVEMMRISYCASEILLNTHRTSAITKKLSIWC